MRTPLKFLMLASTGLSAFGVLLLAAAVALVIFNRGHSAISLDFLTTETTEAGASGGILWQLVGTLTLILTAALVAVPFATAFALLHSFFLKENGFARRTLGFGIQILNAVPSIIFGILGLLVFTRLLDWGKSWLAGGILLGIMIIPTIAAMLAHRIAALPREQLEAAAGLGLRRGQIVCAVVMPQSAAALLSGLLLGLARAAGETAPILFVATIFSGATFPHGIKDQPLLSLSYHIFVLAQDSFHESSHANLWGSALVLVTLVTLLGALAIPLRHKLHNAADHA
jgi:phosphate transport system permease protein